MSLLNDRTDYFMRWWDQVEDRLLHACDGKARVPVKNDGHGVFAANTLRRMGYYVRMLPGDGWFRYMEIEKGRQ
jgi:hypothetical protein